MVRSLPHVHRRYNIIFDPYSRQELAIRFPVHPDRNFDHRFIPLPAQKDRISIDVFEQQVEQHVEAGWNGKPIPGISLEKLEWTNQKAKPIKIENVEVTK